MLERKTLLVVVLLLIVACSSESNNTYKADSSDIEIYLTSLGVIDKEFLSEENISVSNTINVIIAEEVELLFVEVFLDQKLYKTFDKSTFSFSIDTNQMDDGIHLLSIRFHTNTEDVIEKSVNFKIDKTGPKLKKSEIDKINVCKETLIQPLISDALSNVKSVNVFLDDELIAQFNNETEYSVLLNPENYNLGTKYLKFIMTDEFENVSKDSLEVDIQEGLLSINFPDNFTRKDTDKFYVILSDSDGNFIESHTHSDKAEILDLCVSEVFDENNSYTLSFVEEFQSSIYRFYIYSNLTKDNVGEILTFKSRPNFLKNSILNIDIPFYQNGYEISARGLGYSMMKQNENSIMSGHYTTSYNDNLGSEKVFVKYYNKNNLNDYKWIFLDDVQNRNTLSIEDFSEDNVDYKTILVNNNNYNLAPLLYIYGFENEAHYNTINGHQLYGDYLADGIYNSYRYFYANIFHETFYTLTTSNYSHTSNYSIQGIGIPPQILDVPDDIVTCNFSNNKLTFSGLPDYEVGRVMLNNRDVENITAICTFNGKANEINLPKLPDHLFSQNVRDVFNSSRLNLAQAMAEDYSDFNSYEDYLSKVLVTSTPFYISSAQRQRVYFNANGIYSYFPLTEFPYNQAF
ncbi:hypothetical protein [Aestuariibaculum lutulentum]|uniref:Uncharacterized protein n=1 Tax=Aestuariibaculum lutulentum TaxID=2920935 RepID=A0ABS9RF62_9FLAO|nr:hypothetical protein [Aestuariibaculum lutulentum]MCH4551542.1 hypothetical protein [Aestuariibaculum lutulentum]